MPQKENNVGLSTLNPKGPHPADQSLPATPLLATPLPPSPTRITIQLPTQEDVTESRREKCASCCKRFIAFLFSTVGLSTLMVGYTIMGGFIFRHLEADREVKLKTGVVATRRWHVLRLWNVTLEMNVFFKDNWTAVAEALFANYTQSVYNTVIKQGWDGKDSDAELQWTFAGALLYSVTVITTIGYGHIAPKTHWGRIVTIVYAIFGIPLSLLTLTNIGSFMATVFRFLYSNVLCGLCCVCCVCCPRTRNLPPRESRLRRQSTKLTTTRWVRREQDCDAAENGEADDPRKRNDGAGDEGGRDSFRRSMHDLWHYSIDRLKTTEDINHVTVPIYISLLIITTYILGGAALFSGWEKDWSFLEGSYFCFITLTTIGFGDYVPGASVDSRAGQEKLAFCAVYVLFGLSLIAMCFDLMQEEARHKFRALGRRLGLLQK